MATQEQVRTSYLQTPLWQALDAMRIEPPGAALSFRAPGLAASRAGASATAYAVIEEYRRFLFLAATGDTAGHPVRRMSTKRGTSISPIPGTIGTSCAAESLASRSTMTRAEGGAAAADALLRSICDDAGPIRGACSASRRARTFGRSRAGTDFARKDDRLWPRFSRSDRMLALARDRLHGAQPRNGSNGCLIYGCPDRRDGWFGGVLW